METLAFIAVIVVLGYLFSPGRKAAYQAKRDEENRRAWTEVAEADLARKIDRQDRAEGDLFAFVDQHARTLQMKKRQLTFVDSYGRENISAFNRELDYFVEDVVPPEIRAAYLDHWGEDATLVMTVAVQTQLMRRRENEPSEIEYERDMPGVAFERLVADRFVAAGAQVRFTPVTGDQGADLLVDRKGEMFAIQCKRSSSTVGNGAVQEVNAGRQFYDTQHAWVVSDAPFSRSARQLAKSLNVRLIDLDQIGDELEQLGSIACTTSDD